ncbi:MAG: type I restriction modification enzyme protein S [Nitrospirales bacterium]|nr:MAG: type I restriction modification enzyme protein S [Nitrospirales bacterium]
MKDGWQRNQLGELAELKGRIGWRGLTAKEYTKSGPLFLSVHSLNSCDYVDFRDAFHISEERYLESPEIMLQSDDVLICKDGAGIGKVGIVGELPDRTTINSSLLLIRSGKNILPKFLYRCLSSPYFQQIVNSRLNGATTPHLYQRDITEFPVFLPPLPEQQRIVGILDEAFEGIATAKANAEKNLQNARALFDSHLQSVFNQRGEGWEEKRLGDIAVFKNGLNFTRQSKGQTLRMVGVGDFQDNSVVPIGLLQLVTIDGELSNDYLIRRDDILTVRSNGSKDLVGRCMLVPNVGGMISYSGFIIRIRFDTRQISPRFLLRFMKSSETRERLTRDGGGANISNINQAKLSELPISLPSFSQQEEITSRFDALATETQRLESIYKEKLSALDELKKSLLDQAFSGQL